MVIVGLLESVGVAGFLSRSVGAIFAIAIIFSSFSFIWFFPSDANDSIFSFIWSLSSILASDESGITFPITDGSLSSFTFCIFSSVLLARESFLFCNFSLVVSTVSLAFSDVCWIASDAFSFTDDLIWLVALEILSFVLFAVSLALVDVCWTASVVFSFACFADDLALLDALSFCLEISFAKDLVLSVAVCLESLTVAVMACFLEETCLSSNVSLVGFSRFCSSSGTCVLPQTAPILYGTAPGSLR